MSLGAKCQYGNFQVTMVVRQVRPIVAGVGCSVPGFTSPKWPPFVTRQGLQVKTLIEGLEVTYSLRV